MNDYERFKEFLIQADLSKDVTEIRKTFGFEVIIELQDEDLPDTGKAQFVFNSQGKLLEYFFFCGDH